MKVAAGTAPMRSAQLPTEHHPEITFWTGFEYIFMGPLEKGLIGYHIIIFTSKSFQTDGLTADGQVLYVDV